LQIFFCPNFSQHLSSFALNVCQRLFELFGTGARLSDPKQLF